MENKINSLITLIETFLKFFTKLGNKLSEEQVLKLIVDPIIERLWEFNFAPNELNEPGTYESEVKVMVGHDSTIYPDRVLICNNGKKLVIEGKGTNERLDEYVGQLETSVIASGASVGILWNGTELRVYLTTNDGKMEQTPYKTIYLMDMKDGDHEFIINFFDPKHTINDAQMKRERDARRKQDEENALSNYIIAALVNKATNPKIDDIKEPYKQYKQQSQVQTSTLHSILDKIATTYIEELKKNLVGNAIAEARKKEAMKNKTEPEEYAIANLVEFCIEQNHGSVLWVDDEEASRSIIQRADSKKTIMWIVGEVTERGYVFKGICFPNINKSKGKLIPISDPKEVVRGEMFTNLLYIYDHINASVDEWKSFYRANFEE